MDIINFKIYDNYKIELVFKNGEVRIFDIKPLLNTKPWFKLKSKKLLNKAYLAYGTLCWPGEIDIAPETLYIDSFPVEITI
jgi:hypothetical protein